MSDPGKVMKKVKEVIPVDLYDELVEAIGEFQASEHKFASGIAYNEGWDEGWSEGYCAGHADGREEGVAYAQVYA